MGKKSKKGSTRARNQRPAAGQGVAGRSKTASEDGRSIASRDDLSMALSTESGEKDVLLSPSSTVNETTSTDGSGLENNKENSKNTRARGNTDKPAVVHVMQAEPVLEPVLEPELASKVEESVTVEPAVKDPKPESVVEPQTKKKPEPAMELESKPAERSLEQNPVWNSNLRDVVHKTPAVLDVTLDDNQLETSPENSKAVAEGAPTAQSRGFSLTEPASKEAGTDQRDCGLCAIL
jgi:hypothetical protein